MSNYLISFPAAAMVVPAEELPAVAEAAHAVIREAKAAGVYVFAGGIDAAVAPLRVAGDGSVREGAGSTSPTLDGGFAVLELPSREAALTWAARLAAACRCEQELRVFMFDPES
ncbi:transcription initiation protein [Paucibacter sp. B51]|uniref:transcription initiation protein n=1 Tax=Paucibacter sp. B51 TaxID=2993315 RepID=UPI0022EBB5EE|nr:transcription initiation protein [Paucibacter sp. B51]